MKLRFLIILCFSLTGCMYKPVIHKPKMPPAKAEPKAIHNMDCKKEWGVIICKS